MDKSDFDDYDSDSEENWVNRENKRAESTDSDSEVRLCHTSSLLCVEESMS